MKRDGLVYVIVHLQTAPVPAIGERADLSLRNDCSTKALSSTAVDTGQVDRACVYSSVIMQMRKRTVLEGETRLSEETQGIKKKSRCKIISPGLHYKKTTSQNLYRSTLHLHLSAKTLF